MADEQKRPEKDSNAIETFFLKSKVKEYIKSKGLKTAHNVTHGTKLDKYIKDVLDRAIERVQEFDMKTLMEKHL